MRYKALFSLILVSFLLLLAQSCGSTKFVPDGAYLLESAKVQIDSQSISRWEMESYIKQKPNFKTFSIFKLPLTLYNLSGNDSTKWINRTLRNAGEPPVLYDSTLVYRTVADLDRMMTNKGYLNARVFPSISLKNKRAKIIYNIEAGTPYTVNSYKIGVNDSVIADKIQMLPTNRFSRNRDKQGSNALRDTDSLLINNTLVRENAVFDLDVLDLERDRITALLRRSGYYAFGKDNVGFTADTTQGINSVNLELVIYPLAVDATMPQGMKHKQYIVEEVDIFVDFNPLRDGNISGYQTSSIYEKDRTKVIYGTKGEYINPEALLNACYIRPGILYDEDMTSLTYNAFSQLKTLKNVNIRFFPFSDRDSTLLRCIITCVPEKRQGLSTEVEGTNSSGFFGLGVGLGYLHRNVFKSSELFSIKAKGAYEAITPSFSSFKDNYFEIGGEAALTFPRFMFPLLSTDYKRQVHASTQINANYIFQRRPGYFTRTVLSSGVKYIWQDRRLSSTRHVFDLIDVSYVHIPTIDSTFNSNLTENARRYSFKDQFIMSAGYTFTKTNINDPKRRSPLSYSLRASVETAGNALALVALIGNVKADELGAKKIFGTSFAQYVRGMADYSQTIRVDKRNAIAWRIGGGIAYPYGNFKEIPLQKRFFSGGANSVRGWSIRELGPGSYYNQNATFYNHSGDIRFDANIEYRTKLFWVIELGAFIDAGNIWTMSEYKGQENGSFKLGRFYKEIATSWGLGLRFDFDFLLVRLDCGWKAYDPANNPNASHWRIKEPLNIKENTAWHIAVGYPF